MLIHPDTDRYRDLFGALDQAFTSRLPPHGVLVEALADPSIDPNVIDERFDITGSIGSAGLLRAQGVRDLQSGVRHMMRALAVPRLGVGADASHGFRSQLLPAVQNIMKPEAIASSLEGQAVQVALGLATAPNKAAVVGRAAFGVGLSALSAMGPIGAAAAAIIGFAAAIFSAFRRRKLAAAKDAKARRIEAYRLMPPLQQPREQVDTWYVNNVLLPVMEGGQWTRVFKPRFDPRREWVGIEREGGFAFAPGIETKNEDAFGNASQVFEPTDGIGFLPGMNRITSVVQVSLDPESSAVDHWYTRGGPWPIHQQMVQDVGDFYVNTGRLAAVMWAWATQQDASPHLYKIHVGEPGGPGDDHLHYLWREYCRGGLRYLRENALDYYAIDPRTGPSRERVRNSGNREFLFGSAIACAIGAWRCRQTGGTNTHPTYSSLTEGAWEREDMKRPGLGPGRMGEMGCVMDPPSTFAGTAERPCLTTLYETYLCDLLIRVRRRQEHFLKHSLACAYVRSSWDAFRDPTLREQLNRMRATLLEHPDRKLVDLRDVPTGEMFEGRDWRERLIESGVPKFRTITTLAVAPGTLEPVTKPPPKVPYVGASMPFTDVVVPPPARSGVWSSAAALGVVALLGGGALALHRYRSREW